MAERTCFLLLVLFANTHSFLYKPNINSRRVNLALETVLEFNDKDKQADLKLLDNIQHVITEIRTVIGKNNNISKVKNFRRNFRDDTLTDFIQEAVIILNTYEDIAFEEFIRILNKEIRNYNYRGCKFYELMKNNEIEKFIRVKFDSFEDKSTRFKKAAIIAISDVLKYKNNDNNFKELVDYINSLYRQAGDMFQKVLSDLQSYEKLKSRNPKTDLVKIIKNGLRSIIFDHYTNLSINERRLLKRKIETLWKRYKHNLPSKGNISYKKPYNPKVFRNIRNEPDPTKFKVYKKTKLNKIKTKHSKQEKVVLEHKDIKNTKKQHKLTTEGNADEPRDIQKNKAVQTLQDDLGIKHRSDIKHTQDIDSQSSSLESREPNQDQQHKTSVQNVYKLKKSTKEPEEIESLNVAKSIPINNTSQKLIWIEESTGRLPRAVLDKLANKSRGSTSNHNLGRKINKNSHKYKRNKVHNKQRGTVHRPELTMTRRKGYGVGYDKDNGKKYYLKNQRLRTRYSDSHETIFEPEYEQTFENISKQYHKNAYESNYESQYEKTTEKVREHATKNYKTRETILYESDYHKMHDKTFESENERTRGNVYDRQHNKPHRGFQEKRQKFNRKILKKHQYNMSKRPLRINKRNNRLTRSTTKQFLQMLDVHIPKETGKAMKSLARRTVATSKLPGPARYPQVQGNEKEILEPTEQTLPAPEFVKNPERNLNEVKNEASNKTEEVSTVKHRFVVKSNIVKPKENVNMSTLDENQFVIDYNNRLDIDENVGNKTEFINEHEEFEDLLKPEAKLTPDYANEFHSNDISKQDKPNMAGAAYKNKEPLINNISDRDSKINKYDKEREIMPEIKFQPESPIDYKVRQNKFKISGVSVDKKDYAIEKHEDSKINLYETGFRSGIKLTNETEIIMNNTDSLIHHIMDKDVKNKENVTKTDVKSKNIFIPVTDIIPNDNQDGQNETKMKATADNKRHFLAESAINLDSIKNNTQNSKKSDTILRSDINRDFQVTQNEIKIPATADNEIEPINENNNVKDIDFTINDLGNVFEKTNKFEARFHKPDLQSMLDNIKETIKESNLIETPDILAEFQHAQDKNANINIENDLMFRTGANNLKNQTMITGTVHHKTNLNEKESKSKKEIADDYHRIYQVNGETLMNGDTQKEKDNIKSTKQQDIVKEDLNIININTVNLESKYKKNTDMKVKTDQDLLHNNAAAVTKDTTITVWNLYSTSTPVETTKYTTTTVNTTIAVTGPKKTKITVPVSVPIVTSSKLPEV